MALKDRDRTRPRRLVRLGIIRLGYKEKRKRKDGSEYEFPVQADHFVLTDAQELTDVYGEMPRELDVILPFPEIARNFDAAYTVWAGGVLVCRGDGEFVEYAAPFKVKEKDNGTISVYNDAGDTQVSGGAAQVAFDWNGAHFEPGELVPCSGASQDLYPHCRACRMSAILKVMMADPRLFRLGYYQIATGSGRNYDTILGTLELIGNQAGRVNGIPFKLRLVEEQITYRESGKRKKTNKWFLQLEPDPTFTRKLYSKTASGILALPSGDDESDDVGEAYEAEFTEADEPAPPPFAEDGGPAEEAETETQADAPFQNPEAAIAWAMTQNVFDHRKHCENAYEKVKRETNPQNATEMAAAWRSDVANRVYLKKAMAYEIDGVSIAATFDNVGVYGLQDLLAAEQEKGDDGNWQTIDYLNAVIDYELKKMKE